MKLHWTHAAAAGIGAAAAIAGLVLARSATARARHEETARRVLAKREIRPRDEAELNDSLDSVTRALREKDPIV